VAKRAAHRAPAAEPRADHAAAPRAQDTGDTRETPAIDVCKGLTNDGAKLVIYDPKVTEQQIHQDLATPKFEWDHPQNSGAKSPRSAAITVVEDAYKARARPAPLISHKSVKPKCLFCVYPVRTSNAEGGHCRGRLPRACWARAGCFARRALEQLPLQTRSRRRRAPPYRLQRCLKTLVTMSSPCSLRPCGAPLRAPALASEADAAAPPRPQACEGAHGIAILTEWDEFKKLDYERIYASMMKPAFVFDGRNILDHAKLRDIGYIVYALGKPLDPFLKRG
jgi:hypothetical protein